MFITATSSCCQIKRLKRIETTWKLERFTYFSVTYLELKSNYRGYKKNNKLRVSSKTQTCFMKIDLWWPFLWQHKKTTTAICLDCDDHIITFLLDACPWRTRRNKVSGTSTFSRLSTETDSLEHMVCRHETLVNKVNFPTRWKPNIQLLLQHQANTSLICLFLIERFKCLNKNGTLLCFLIEMSTQMPPK